MVETNCKNLDDFDNYYIVKITNLETNDIMYSNSPSVDDKNCIEFTK